MTSRKEIRTNAMLVVYMLLMSDKDVDFILDDNEFATSTGNFIPSISLDEELLDACYRVEERMNIYIQVVESVLKEGWKFDRLGKIEQSILLLALAELEQGFQAKAIIVNEAIELAKNYADDNSFRLINGVLDSL